MLNRLQIAFCLLQLSAMPKKRKHICFTSKERNKPKHDDAADAIEISKAKQPKVWAEVHCLDKLVPGHAWLPRRNILEKPAGDECPEVQEARCDITSAKAKAMAIAEETKTDTANAAPAPSKFVPKRSLAFSMLTDEETASSFRAQQVFDKLNRKCRALQKQARWIDNNRMSTEDIQTVKSTALEAASTVALQKQKFQIGESVDNWWANWFKAGKLPLTASKKKGGEPAWYMSTVDSYKGILTLHYCDSVFTGHTYTIH